MDALEAIHTRRSIRKYEDKPVSDKLIKKILAAAMSAPSAGNEQPWQFVVITERDILSQISKVNPYSAMAGKAPVAILVCGDLSLEKFPGNWVLDCSAATQNLLLAAHALGLGAVWTGVYPEKDRMEGFRLLMKLPESVIPHSLVVMGYPAQHLPQQDRCIEERIHNNRW